MKNRDKTIKDFGDQWLRYHDNEGYYGSLELFSDILSPFLKLDDLKGGKVAEIGSGTGRIVNMLLEAGAKHIIAVEPSDAFEVLKNNVKEPPKVTFLKITGDQLPPNGDLDYIFSIGVLHHIKDPKPVVKAVYKALRPGGYFLVWLYGKEGNRLYLTFIEPLRILTKRMPHFMLALIVEMIYRLIVVYIKICHKFRLPLKEYMLSVFERMSPSKRRLIIYDQLNPFYSKYYSKLEVEKLILEGGFKNIRLHHRHGYSWTAIGEKPYV